MSAKLQVAWCWSCPACGHEQFLKPLTGDATEVAEIIANHGAETVAGEPVGIFLAPADDVLTDADGEAYEAGSLIQAIAIAPKYVTCRQCRRQHAAEIDFVEELPE